MMTSLSCFFRYFLLLGQRGPSKVCRVGTRWMQNLILHPTSYPDRNQSKNTGRYVKNTNKKVVFFFSSSKINNYYFLIFLFYYFPQEVHFRPQISSNGSVLFRWLDDQLLMVEDYAYARTEFRGDLDLPLPIGT